MVTNNWQTMTSYRADKTLVGYFDIYAYSSFIEKYPLDECLSKVRNLFKPVVMDMGSFFIDIRVKHWIFSDSIMNILQK